MKNHVTQSYLFQGPFGDTGAAGGAGIVGPRVSKSASYVSSTLQYVISIHAFECLIWIHPFMNLLIMVEETFYGIAFLLH